MTGIFLAEKNLGLSDSMSEMFNENVYGYVSSLQSSKTFNPGKTAVTKNATDQSKPDTQGNLVFQPTENRSDLGACSKINKQFIIVIKLALRSLTSTDSPVGRSY